MYREILFSGFVILLVGYCSGLMLDRDNLDDELEEDSILEEEEKDKISEFIQKSSLPEYDLQHKKDDIKNELSTDEIVSQSEQSPNVYTYDCHQGDCSSIPYEKVSHSDDVIEHKFIENVFKVEELKLDSDCSGSMPSCDKDEVSSSPDFNPNYVNGPHDQVSLPLKYSDDSDTFDSNSSEKETDELNISLDNDDFSSELNFMEVDEFGNPVL